jgi:AmmeMemoRadiSam system protein B
MANQIIKSKGSERKKGIVTISFFLGLCWLGLVVLTGCPAVSTPVDKGVDSWPEKAAVTEKVKAMILPHHLLVASFMEKFYAEIAAKNTYDRVVILSPNHFGYGHNFLQTTDKLPDPDSLDRQWVKELDSSRTARIENTDFGLEHGIYVHYPFLKKYFPGAKLVAVTVKDKTPCAELDRLAGKLMDLEKVSPGRTLYVASLDFSHYSSEEIAAANDRRTLSWLGRVSGADGDMCREATETAVSLDTKTPDAVAIDSPGVIYTLRKIMDGPETKERKVFQFWNRTSSASMMSSVRPVDNTSHIYGFYTAD